MSRLSGDWPIALRYRFFADDQFAQDDAAAELDENGKRLKLNQVRTAFADLVKVWDVMFPVEQYKFIRSIIAGITVYPDKVKIEYDTAGLEQIIAETEGVK